MLVFGLVRGVAGGGDLNIALWESRFLFYAVITFVLAANTIRTYAQLRCADQPSASWRWPRMPSKARIGGLA